jgi:hypothetical protein
LLYIKFAEEKYQNDKDPWVVAGGLGSFFWGMKDV